MSSVTGVGWGWEASEASEGGMAGMGGLGGLGGVVGMGMGGLPMYLEPPYEPPYVLTASLQPPPGQVSSPCNPNRSPNPLLP